MTVEKAPSLEVLRGEIDEIDDALHALIMRRAALQRAIARAKAADGAGETRFLRPEREAAILRRLASRHQGDYPLAVVLRVWRELITAGLSVQSPITVDVLGADNPVAYWDLARGFFGATARMRLAATASALLRDVATKPGALGVVPAPQGEGERAPWWTQLVSDAPSAMEKGRPRVIARLPFFFAEGAEPAHKAFVLAAVPLEPSGADTMLLVARAGAEVSRTRMQEAVGALDVGGSILATASEPGGARAMLLAHPGFIAESDPRLGAAAGHGLLGLHLIGGYADPIRMRA